MAKKKSKKKQTTKKKVSPKKKVLSKKKLSPKKKVSSKKKLSPKKKVSPKKKASGKKKVSSKISKQLKLIKKNQKLAFKIDLRKLTKNQKDYVKKIREGYKKGEWKKKLTKYLGVGLIEYYRIYNQPDLITNLPKAIGISKSTFDKILKGKKVSSQTYKKFNNFLETKLNNYETAFLFRIGDYLKNNRGKISRSAVLSIVNELYEFLNYYDYEDFSELSYYDYLHIYYP